MTRIYSYKMTHDSGFAPNPFQGFLTLATCKPSMRQNNVVGDWIAGFTSKYLSGDEVGQERLVYLMQVSEKVSFAEYFNDPRFGAKKPMLAGEGMLWKAGDNIYKPLPDGGFEQMPNYNHDETNQTEDVSGGHVLVARDAFWYFGKGAIAVAGINKPVSQSPYGVLTTEEMAEHFIGYIRHHYPAGGVYDRPHDWPENDSSWRP